MQIQFLGGASGVGASCILAEIGERRILIDAGVRMGGSDRLPDMTALSGQGLDAILVTHAHADHIGALPIIASVFPATPIYATSATIRLMEVMLADALRVMERRAANELELPLFDAAQVAAVLSRLRPIHLGANQLLELPNLVVTASHAGHIAGAVSYGIAAADGRLVISGDVSVTPQRTILGATTLALTHPDVLVLESTYGARLHASRTQEEARLAQSVAEAVTHGHVLIPAFALGRAQEVILILRDAQRRGSIPEFPIVVDGLVRAVCAAYVGIREALAPRLQRTIDRGYPIFFGRGVRDITTQLERERVLAGPPACIITSSGMLTGGPSLWYAERLVGNSDAAIFLTGYQDEEAPGRRLLDAIGRADVSIPLGTQSLAVRCRIDRYNLSAHADGLELTALVRQAKPKLVALVHGDPEARAALAAQLRSISGVEVALPNDGDLITFTPATSRPVAPRSAQVPPIPAAIGNGQALTVATLPQLRAAIPLASNGPTIVSTHDLGRLWYGPNVDPQQIAELQQVLGLAGTTIGLSVLDGVADLWKLKVDQLVSTPSPESAGPAALISTSGGVNAQRIQEIISSTFGDAADLYRRSIDPVSGAVTLSFHFPDVALMRYDRQLVALHEQLPGLTISVRPDAHQGKLSEVARALIPSGWALESTPSIRIQQRTIELRLRGSGPLDQQALIAEFYAQTGWRLVISAPGADQQAPTEPTFLPAQAARIAIPNEVLIVAAPPEWRMPIEQNQALQLVRQAFTANELVRVAVLNSSLLALHCTFPLVAARQYAATLTYLAEETGWHVVILDRPNESNLIEVIQEVLQAAETARVGSYRFDWPNHMLTVRIDRAPTLPVADLAAAFQERTGWQLQLIS
ncbi:MAG: MBL fold metallo-hydrolase [Roseiflexaceae bacterium]|nr:MBL fold metallo-hydrolase [Roseiflexaceae bacterium]